MMNFQFYFGLLLGAVNIAIIMGKMYNPNKWYYDVITTVIITFAIIGISEFIKYIIKSIKIKSKGE